MANSIQYISWIFVILLAVTVLNLFFKPRNGGMLSQAMEAVATMMWSSKEEEEEEKTYGTSWDSTAQCVLRGYRCADDDEPCDCDACPGLRKFHVGENDSIVVLDRRLTPGTYCLPQRGKTEACDERTQIALYSVAGWTCVDRNRGVFRSETAASACHHHLAKDNDENYLVDLTTGRPVDESDLNAIDLYERVEEPAAVAGQPTKPQRRYGCHCGSLDVFGHAMVSPLPFVCAADYCLRDLKLNPFTNGLGWKNGKCVCGPYQHLVPHDPTSPCVDITSRLVDHNRKIVLRSECTTRLDFERKPWYCPPEHEGGVLRVEEKVMIGTTASTFLDQHLMK